MPTASLAVHHFDQDGFGDETDEAETEREEQHEIAPFAGLRFLAHLPDDEQHPADQPADPENERPGFELLDAHENAPAQNSGARILRSGAGRRKGYPVNVLRRLTQSPVSHPLRDRNLNIATWCGSINGLRYAFNRALDAGPAGCGQHNYGDLSAREILLISKILVGRDQNGKAVLFGRS